MIRDVFTAENPPVEAKEIKTIQRISGRYRPIRLAVGFCCVDELDKVTFNKETSN